MRRVQLREHREESLLVFETAQVELQRIVFDPADHRYRQIPQLRGEPIHAAPLAISDFDPPVPPPASPGRPPWASAPFSTGKPE